MAKRGSKAGAKPPEDSFERLIAEMENLPGIGRRSAERMAYYLLGVSRDEAMKLAHAIRDVKANLHPCVECGDLTEKERCAVCLDERRDSGVVCVVEWPREVRALEKSGQYNGRYHVLMGRLSPLSGVEPVLMADAMRKGVEAGRLARAAGRIPRKLYATASSPSEGLLS